MQKTHKASVLVVTLVIMGIILTSAMSISLISIKERKASIGSNKSNQAYQIADSGIEKVMDALISNPTKNLNSLGLSCSANAAGHAVLTNASVGYTVELKKSVEASATTCASTKSSEITRIKSIGTVAGQSQRAIEAAVNTVACGETVSKDSVDYSTVLAEDGKCWLASNLGTSVIAGSSTDSAAYGWLFQWGRSADDHQKTNSTTTTTLSNSDTPGSNFIIASAAPKDWRSPQKDNLWQGVDGTNNPCPSGFRLPTKIDWDNLISMANITKDTTAFSSSTLKLTVAGYRSYSDGSGLLSGTGNYWSSSVDGGGASEFGFDSSSVSVGAASRAYGFSVRCIKN